jgi:hypothetical protein
MEKIKTGEWKHEDWRMEKRRLASEKMTTGEWKNED